ncbi:MAG: Uma2 family endonuclease [Planctomycetes bacterium]|nr:Uma2 family endonuclease [Planctomycetota bacterium]
MTSNRAVTAKLSYRDYCLIPADGLRHEILDGEHVVAPSPGTAHQRTLARLLRALQCYVEDRGLGEVFVAPYDVVLGPHDIVQPDLLVVVPAHADRIHDDGVHGAPDLVIEILSPGTRATDLGRKRERYAECGVPEYWIVDPSARTIRQLAHVGGTYEDRGDHPDRIQLAVLPEVVLELAPVW